MFNDNDFMGGIFDFDGNGKTTLDEQYVAYKIYEETTKEQESNGTYHKPIKRSTANNTPVSEKDRKTGNMIGFIAVIISLILLLAKCSTNNKNDSSYKSSYHRSYSYSSSYPSYSSRSTSTTTSSNTYSSSSSYSGYSSSSKSKTYSYGNKTSSKSKDEYNAKDYYDAEDFYEDHYDDFFDYEDAEDYYDEHYDD